MSVQGDRTENNRITAIRDMTKSTKIKEKDFLGPMKLISTINLKREIAANLHKILTGKNVPHK